MLAQVCSAVVILLVSAQPLWAQNSSSRPASSTSPTSSTPSTSISGSWRAPTERLPLTGDFNEQVWGKGATSVRDVTLTVNAKGEGTLTVSRRVLDARGRVVPGSASVEKADITVGASEPGFATRLDHAVKVLKAERSYPDDPKDTWPLDQLRVGVVSFTDTADRIEVRFEPQDGKGSFSELMTRQRATARR